jgi:hypothetical protein
MDSKVELVLLVQMVTKEVLEQLVQVVKLVSKVELVLLDQVVTKDSKVLLVDLVNKGEWVQLEQQDSKG